ncbi:MAG: DUF4387 domain-containing protein [Firmicutes bacterium HGW-Firmicutes-12]|jgi:hypothetical protein|nr:MAG: DUF4387 domain-containing protein [Firmicutes bacterium HGW-Firmicutes-12]
MTRLIDLAGVLRSKNAGPLDITFDVMFTDKEVYERVKNSGVINKVLISQEYNVNLEDVLITEFDIVNTIKITIPRKYVSGDIKDTDIYGCQQHSPLANVLIP